MQLARLVARMFYSVPPESRAGAYWKAGEHRIRELFALGLELGDFRPHDMVAAADDDPFVRLLGLPIEYDEHNPNGLHLVVELAEPREEPWHA